MKADAFQLFKSMYYILDNIWRKNHEEDLRIYLSDADPIFYENGQSLDPVVFEDFKALYMKKESEEISDYDFIIYYLNQLDSYYGDIKRYFVSISKDEYEKSISNIVGK